ncbi:hypothetical protein AAIB78_001653 [Morganella morganii]
MSTSANEKQVNASVIYKLILIGLSIPMIFISLLSGIMGAFGYGTVLVNGKW